jgi:hypothetical protein
MLYMRHDELHRRYMAGEIGDAEFKRLEREAREQPDPCWHSETYEQVRKAMMPSRRLRDTFEERTAAAR